MAKKELTLEEELAEIRKQRNGETASDESKVVPSGDKPLSLKEELELFKKDKEERIRQDAIKSLEYDAYEKFEDENYNIIERNITRPLGYGLNRIGEGLAKTAEVYAGGIGDETIRAITPDAPENYISASELFTNSGNDGFRWSNLPAAILEQGPGMAGTAGSAAIGGLIAGPAGAFGAGTAFNTAISAGDNAQARAAADGRTEINAMDRLAGAGTAAAVGAVETLPFTRGAGGIIKRTLAEGATEGLQSGIEQVGTTLGTAQGLTIDPKQAAAEAIMGAGAGAGIRPVIDGAGRSIPPAIDIVAGASGVPVNSEMLGITHEVAKEKGAQVLDKLAATDVNGTKVDEYDTELAQLYVDNGALDSFKNPWSDSPNEGARGTLDAVEKRLKKDIKYAASELKQIANKAKNKDIAKEIDVISSLGETRTGRVDENTFKPLDGYFGNDAAYARFKGAIIMNQRNTILRDQNNLTGGISGFINRTASNLPIIGNKFTPFKEAGNPSLPAQATAAGMGFALGGPVGAGLALAGTHAIGLLDRKTNRQSRPKRYLDTVHEAQKQSRVLPKPQIHAELLQMAENAKLEREAAVAQRTGRVEANTELTRKTVGNMFETGIIPETEYYTPYKMWSEAIGKNPKEILNGIQVLEKEGALPEGTAERFTVNIRSFSTKGNETYDIQELVRQKISPDYSPIKAKAERAKKDPKVVLETLKANKTGISGDRRKHKAREGERRALNVIAEIEQGKTALNDSQYLTLHKLKEAIDRPDVTALEREKMVKDTLGHVFDSPLELQYWNKVFAPLTAIGNDKPIYREDEGYNPFADPNQLNLPM